MTMIEKPIQLANISEELARLWNAEKGTNKIRASLFNLILYVQKKDRDEMYQSLIKSVISKFPCRVIFILNDDNAGEEYLRTSVSSETLSSKELMIYCEIIRIEVAGKLSERVPFIILPHILPDLPVYLLWTQDPSTENAVLPYVEPFANRLIFDAKSATNLQQYCKAVLSLIERFGENISDLTWSALSGWRQLFSQVFNKQEALSSLSASKMIRIGYCTNPTQEQHYPEIEAAYLQAWIASRLNWKFQGIEKNEGNIRLTYHSATEEVVFFLIPQESLTETSGTILALEIESAQNKGSFQFKKHPKTDQMCIQYSNKDRCDLPYYSYLSQQPEGQSILQEIFQPSGGQHYQSMLEILAATPWRFK